MKLFCKRRRIVRIAVALTAVLTLAFPAGAQAATAEPVLSGSSAVTKGKTVQLTVKDGKKKVSSKSCKWYTTKKSVATVTRTGKVTGKKNGTAYIYVKYKGQLSAKKKLVVSTASLSKKKLSLKGGKNYKLKTKYAGKYVKPVYKSSNKKVATVDKNGRVIALKRGKATISAGYKGSIAKCTVTVTSNHTHRWTYYKEYKRVWVPKIVTVTDYETRQVPTEVIKVLWHCNCGDVIEDKDDSVSEHMMMHIQSGEPNNGWDEAVYKYETQRVKVTRKEDHGSYKTKVSSYYYCSCGARK